MYASCLENELKMERNKRKKMNIELSQTKQGQVHIISTYHYTDTLNRHWRGNGTVREIKEPWDRETWNCVYSATSNDRSIDNWYRTLP